VKTRGRGQTAVVIVDGASNAYKKVNRAYKKVKLERPK
jgi:hypothetical protein